MKKPHTPGPWLKEGATVCQSSTLQTICKTSGKDEVTQSANARLIASAPELLDALESAYNALAWPDEGMTDEEEEELLESIRAALSKAKGEA